MTDKELLELAAKAAGIDLYFEKIGNRLEVTNKNNLKLWNPLEDDGDALRMAVKLGLSLHCGMEQAEAKDYDDTFVRIEDQNGDPYAATRRVIVRAAAEIGRTK